MELQLINQVAKSYGISAQTLRYYEQIGLIQSIRKEDNTYRFYDEEAVKKLHSIILLRKLRISVKQIKEILNNQNTSKTVEIFERNISELDEEITSLSTIKSILTQFADELRVKSDMILQLDLLQDTNTFSIIDSISFSKNYINNVKENLTMEDLNKASETLEKLEEKKSSENIGPEETTENINQGNFNKFEIVKFGPYRFIGKSIYIGNTKGLEEFNVFDYMWDRKNWIFNELDGITEYISDEPYNAALVTWDRYDEKNQLLGYSVGRFFKADTPVPEGLDYIDIPEMHVGKAWWRAENADGRRGGPKNLGKWFAYNDGLVSEEINRTGKYKSHWLYMAEVHPILPVDDGLPLIGTYIPCTLK